MVFASGIPLTRGRKVLGGVGVSGDSESRVAPERKLEPKHFNS